ncbi:MAG: hypothetical protein ACI3VN_06875 [Candidatus Onthomonas sp.]
MKKKDFISLVLGIIGLILFGVGVCMCLLPEWNLFRQGVVVGVVGALVLLVMVFVRRRLEHRPPVRLSPKTVGIVLLAIVGALVLGVGMSMCLCMETAGVELLIPGILVGCVGIVLLLLLIPLCKGLK